MSINPLSSVSSIWSRATTALTGSRDTGTLPPAPPPKQPARADDIQTASASTPFQKLSSDLQAVLVQMQSGRDAPDGADGVQKYASHGSSQAAGARQARPHHHPHPPPAADQSGSTAVAGDAGLATGLSAVA